MTDALATAVLNVLPVGNDKHPDNKVVAFYLTAGELRALRELASKPDGQIAENANCSEASGNVVEARPKWHDLIADPWDLDDPEILERLRDDGMHEAADEMEGLQERFRIAALSAPTRERELLREAREHGLIHVGNANPEAREKYNNLLARIDNLLNEGTR